MATPETTELGELSALNTSTAVKTVLDAKYTDSLAWATWAATLLNDNMVSMASSLSTDEITPKLQSLLALLDSMPVYTPGTVKGYTAPDAPNYTAIPSYIAQTIGEILAIPAVKDFEVPAAPSTVIAVTEDDFSDSVLTALRTKLLADMSGTHTGLGDAEAALFARETARVTAERASAYTEVTSQFAARGFPQPPGALLAKQTEMSNETSRRLTDSSAAIMAESARLAADYGKHVMTVGTQVVSVLAGIFDSKLLRRLEAKKTEVMLAIEGFKATLTGLQVNAELNKTAIEATVSANDGTIKAFLGSIEGQTAPMKAIAEANNAMASAYRAAVDGASADVQASALPEELKLKQADLGLRTIATKGEIAGKAAQLDIEAAMRHLQVSVTTLQGLAQSAAQMVASAINSVNVSSNLGYQGSSSNSNSTSTSESIQHIFEGV